MASHPGSEAPCCLALTGPTASGKSALALAIAAAHACEIISVDSAVVYRGMDIGTAKPTLAERAMVPHHLIDIRDPSQAYNAAQFAADARALVYAINRRGRLALLVGGTMLYFKALFDGLDAMPRTDPAVREQIAQRARELGWPALHAHLAQHDPQTAARLAPTDAQRIGRALEVLEMSGRPLSHWHIAPGQARRADRMHPSAIISLEPQDRPWLHARIAQRFDAMLANGLLDEVRALRARGDLVPELASMRCVGYRQAWQVLDGSAPPGELRERGIAATRQLAKRQLTWLRAMPQRSVVACDGPEPAAQVLALVASVLRRRS